MILQARFASFLLLDDAMRPKLASFFFLNPPHPGKLPSENSRIPNDWLEQSHFDKMEIHWVVPPPRMQSSPPGLWTIFRIGDPDLNLHLPQLLGRGTTQEIHQLIHGGSFSSKQAIVMLWTYFGGGGVVFGRLEFFHQTFMVWYCRVWNKNHGPPILGCFQK